MPVFSRPISVYQRRLCSPIAFLAVFLSPCLLYYTDLSSWFPLQLGLQLAIGLGGLCCKTWRFTAFACTALLVFHNYSWFLPKANGAESCFENADLATGTIQSSSLDRKSTWTLIRVVLSCKTDSVKIPVLTVAAHGKRMKRAYFREGDTIEFSRFELRKRGIWQMELIPSKRAGVFNLTRQRRVLRRSALLIYIQNKAEYYMARFPASVFQALITADGSKMTKRMKRRNRELGITHLFAISGMHVGIIYLWIVFLARILFAFPLKMVEEGYLLLLYDLIGLAIVYLFVDLIGMPISARRALIMLVWWIVMRHLFFWQPLWFVLLGTAAIVLIEQPMAIDQLSFQLSFVAVAGILMLIPYLPQQKDRNSLLKTLRNGLLSSLLISGWLSLILFPLVNRIFPYLFPIAVFGNVLHIFYMGWVYLPIGLLTVGLTVAGFPFYGFPGEYYLFAAVNLLGKLWQGLMATNAVWNRALFWKFEWNWSGWDLVVYWSVLLAAAWLSVRWISNRKST